ncbi:MAG: arylesterase [Alphaproteobacteria bacterium]|jgi:acyl-CoA thioesterase-1|nr:arylesterase [Alphaproteobacteria bacterium]
MPNGYVTRLVKVAVIFLALTILHPGAQAKTILTFGDSLTAGYGLAAKDGFVARLQTTLGQKGAQVVVRNGSVSGDTTAGGRARLAWTLSGTIDLVILELGANDALRGVDPGETRRNLDAILSALNKRGIVVLLAGMLAPPNLGPDYAQSFNSIYPDLAAKHGVTLYPFFLDGVAAKPNLNQRDGLHPNSAGVQVIVDAMVPYVLKLLK